MKVKSLDYTKNKRVCTLYRLDFLLSLLILYTYKFMPHCVSASKL